MRNGTMSSLAALIIVSILIQSAVSQVEQKNTPKDAADAAPYATLREGSWPLRSRGGAVSQRSKFTLTEIRQSSDSPGRYYWNFIREHFAERTGAKIVSLRVLNTPYRLVMVDGNLQPLIIGVKGELWRVEGLGDAFVKSSNAIEIEDRSVTIRVLGIVDGRINWTLDFSDPTAGLIVISQSGGGL